MADELFTPAEIKELVAKGVINESNKHKLTPPELDMYNQAHVEDALKKHQEGGESLFGGEANLEPSVDWGTMAGAALPFVEGMLPAAGRFASGAWDTAKTVGGLLAVNKSLELMHAPADVKNAIMIALGLKGMGSGGGSKSSAPNRTSEAAPAAIPEGVVPQKYGQKIEPFAGASKGRTMDPLQATPGGETFERVVNGGVKNDFRGRVTFRGQPPALQSPSEPDILENVLGTARNGWEDGRGTPLAYGAASDPEVAALQRAIAEALDGAGASRSTMSTPHTPLRLRRP